MKIPENEMGMASAQIVIFSVNRSPGALAQSIPTEKRRSKSASAGAGGPWPELPSWGRSRLRYAVQGSSNLMHVQSLRRSNYTYTLCSKENVRRIR